ncbi:hypothetical protein [Micromonospora mirobrigensis]|uniref:Uncharacterized protein n=1 Tax=Micromonospora mirobrigensis TaxID=262898 RepID=A0A1C4UBB3_9ACTN|nr:hypothetical protein [Micromonospora mirobrigensis]SCE68961.1 hypothetical protein GA0070564_101356 [Micromonospora mirobrigensis]
MRLTRPVPAVLPSAVPPPAVLPYAVLAWAVGYGALRLWWAATGGQHHPPFGSDLVLFTGWWSVGLCAAAGLVGIGLAAARSWRPALAVAGWAVCGAVVVACVLLLLDLVGLLILHPTPAFTVGGFLGRLGCLTGGLLLHAAVLDHRRRYRGGCPECGRTGPARSDRSRVPGWARAGAWAAVGGCLLRLAAQVAVGFDGVPLAQGASMLAFEVGFLLAGVLLPLALVHRWGRIWPGWVPLLAGRRIPPALLLVPATVFAVGLVGYFGVGLVDLAVETATGTFDPGDGRFPLAFFWVAEPAYWVWGWGLGVAAVSFRTRTRPVCPRCGG